MQKIIPHLWFDKEAKQAADFYVSVFENSKIISEVMLHETPSGDSDSLTIELAGQKFMLISAGPYFKLNPAISFMILCDSKEEADKFWEKLSPGGQVMMELGEYPFSPRYGWCNDKFGVSWQIIFMEGHKSTQKIVPSLLFVGDVCGKAEEAINFYISIFHNSKINFLSRRETDQGPDKAGTLNQANFSLEGQKFGAMDSAAPHKFSFNEAVCLLIECENQEEIDYYWEKLSVVPQSEQCGWLKDKYGVSWQANPKILQTMLQEGTPEQVKRVTECFLKMKKLNISELQKAYDGK